MTTIRILGELLRVSDDALRGVGRPVARKVVAAGAVAWDDCCDGVLFAGMPRRFRSLAFPAESAEWRPCDGSPSAIEVVVGLLRCVPTVQEGGRFPTSAAITDSAGSIYEDAEVLWLALEAYACQFPSSAAMVTGQGFVGPEGGCIAVETRMLLDFDAA